MHSFLSDRERRKRKRVSRIKLYLVLALPIFLVIGVIALVRFVPLFHILKVEVSGIEESQALAYKELVIQKVSERIPALLFGGDSYFAWQQAAAPKSPPVAEVEIKKSLFRRTVAIILTPRKRFAIWCGSGVGAQTCTWIDEHGISFEQATPSQGQLILIVYDAGAPLPPLGSSVIEIPKFQIIQDILTKLSLFNIPVRRFKIERKLDELVAETNSGTRIRFSLRFDPLENLSGLRELLKKNPMIGIAEANLTVPGKIYTTDKQ